MEMADVFMFNSTWECNPLVLREAISYGLPIIARNLPQYGDMFTDYLQPIDSDLYIIKANYQIPTDNTTPIFAFKHEEAYRKLLETPAQAQKISINQHFVDGAFLEIKGESDSDFEVKFYDEQGKCHYENTIKSNSWVRLNRQYFTKWTAKVWQDGHLIYKNTLNLANKTVFIVLDSKSLGDTIAWTGYALEFQKKHDCKVVLSTYWNHILDYPELELVEPGTTVNCYALYRIGWKWDENKEPVLCNTIPLQQAATNILGLDYKPLRPKLNHSNQFRIPSWKYVAIATNSTMECKFWTREGWQEVINYMHGLGYDVYNVSKEDNPFDNCTKIDDTSIENTMDVIAGAKLFIGLSSGLSWLAWALNQNIVMISNFTESDHEFECHRITKPDVCHGCWNDPNIKLDPHWLWCPRNKDFECQRTISASMVIDAIKKAGI
jgi:autotransporter strand-loop-strand O-heptosyltransferase